MSQEVTRFGEDQPSRDRESVDPESLEPVSLTPVSLNRAGANIGRRPRSNRRGSNRRLRRAAMIATVGATVVIAAGVLVVMEGHTAAGRATALDSHDRRMQTARTGTRPIQVTASHVGTADIQGAAGQLSIVGTETGPVMLTGELSWAGHAPGTATAVRQPAGRIVMTGLAGPLRLTVTPRLHSSELELLPS